MDLMNKEFSNLTKGLALNPVSAFKQDPKLVTAIDKLFTRQFDDLNAENKELVLPERKLDFSEVQTLLKQATNAVKGTNPTHFKYVIKAS